MGAQAREATVLSYVMIQASLDTIQLQSGQLEFQP